VTIELPLHLGIPTSYVADRDTRLRLYRRLADLMSLAEIDALEEEFTDRFGPIPDSVRNLLYQLKVRLLAEKAGLISVAAEGGQIVLRYPPLAEEAQERSIPEVSPYGRTGKNSIWLVLAGEVPWQERLIAILNRLAGVEVEAPPVK
jgi:transcription-repair coupling factor (superfamily II helicase)